MVEAARVANVHQAQKFSDHAPLSIDYDYQIDASSAAALPCAVASMVAASMRCRPCLLGLAEKRDALTEVARAASIYKAQKFSDHAPLSIDYDFKL